MNTTKNEKDWLRRINNEVGKIEDNKVVAKTEEKKPESRSSSKGNGFADIAGMTKLKEFVTEGFINVLRNREYAAMFGIKPPSMLFYGPSGCGKTFFAEKMAEEVGINFQKIVPDDLACTWVHGTQQKIGELFRNAEKKAPILLFFDEFDAMVPRRSGDESNQHFDGEVNEFLCMLNNANDKGIYVLAASNHPERIDKAVLRTGRIDEMVYIDMPDFDARKSLFELSLSKLPKEDDIDTDKLARLTEGYNCSDINYIVTTAARKMFNVTVNNGNAEVQRISQVILEEIISKRRPSVSASDLREYERIRNEFCPKDEVRKHATIGFR